MKTPFCRPRAAGAAVGEARATRIASLFALLLAMLPAHAAEPDVPAAAQAQLLVHLLDYVAVDYPQFVRDGVVLDQAEYAEQREFAADVARRLPGLHAADRSTALETDAAQLVASIDARASGDAVAKQAIALRDAIVTTFGVASAPRAVPDLANAASVYARSCAACHGAAGHGDGPAGAALEPKPSDFHDAARMQQRSVFGLYNTISLGVGSTGMAAFRELEDDTRWALAFHVASLRHDERQRAVGAAAWRGDAARSLVPDLGALVSTDARALAARGVANADAMLGYLVANPAVFARSNAAHLDEARRLLRSTVQRHAAGDPAGAGELAVAAYLRGFEPVEALLDTRAPTLRVEVESRMQALRQSLRAGASPDEIATRVEAIGTSLDEVERALGEPGNRTATALSAFLILFREGLEAILVVAAVLALVLRSGRREAVRYVHLGWIGALVAGALTWLAARALVDVSGAAREVTEGVSALLASAILLYVGFWLHGKSHAQAWNAFISRHLKGAMTSRAVWALAGVSFLAVYREAFETVLFYETLWAQEGDAGGGSIVLGIAVALAALLGVGVAVFRYGMRLPIGPFFAISALLMAILAVVFAGQGVAALQEAGVVDASVMAFPRIDWLGIHPTTQTLAAQAVALAVVVGIYARPWLARRLSRAAT